MMLLNGGVDLNFVCYFFSSRGLHTRCALVTGVQTCALPIYLRMDLRIRRADVDRPEALRAELVAGQGHAGPILQRTLGGVLDDVGHHMHLDVRGFLVRPGLQEAQPSGSASSRERVCRYV